MILRTFFTGCLAIKFQDLIEGRDIYKGIDWKTFFIFFQSKIILQKNTYKDIKDCLSLCDMLKISSEWRCKGEYITENLDFNIWKSESYLEL